VLLACQVPGRWRRALALGGLPAALLLHSLVADWPAWIWLAPAAVLLALYPLSAWRDAPWFPTPPDALLALAPRLGLAPEARILDAGSGLGHGLIALRRAFPRARLEGVERSALLAWASALRRPDGVAVRRADLWSAPWSGCDLVYLFQRPESMAPAWRKACRELRPGSWLVSLEFPVPGQAPTLQTDAPPGGARAVYAYRIPRPEAVRAQPAGAAADNGSGFRPAMKQQPR
jgi:SAM-dependent methyltransferase